MGAGCVLYAVVRAANRERGIERRVEEARGSMCGERGQYLGTEIVFVRVARGVSCRSRQSDPHL